MVFFETKKIFSRKGERRRKFCSLEISIVKRQEETGSCRIGKVAEIFYSEN